MRGPRRPLFAIGFAARLGLAVLFLVLPVVAILVEVGPGELPR